MQNTRISWLALFVASGILRPLYAGEYFDPGLLQTVNGGATINDTTLLSQGYQPAGTYQVHIDVNGKERLVSAIRFELNKDKQLIPCLSFNTYQKLGVDMNKVDSKNDDNELTNACKPMEEQLPGTKVVYDFATLQLDISIPQTLLQDENEQGIPVEEWDDGIPALITQYQLSGQQYIQQSTNTKDSVFANLTNGVNIGRWRYRNNSTLSNDTGWKSISSYAETAVRSLKGELTVGDASTPADVFDSLLVRGVQLSSDDDMLPEQLNGFAPLIRGIAKSNAKVTVRDNGYVIYQRNVPPGPFVISDLSAVSNGGKLDVTVTEADGSESQSTVAYSNVPQLLRLGQFKYSLVGGHFLSNEGAVMDNPEIAQFTLSYGLPMNTTLYGGSQLQDQFKAFSTGIGIDLQRFGGIAVDNTHSRAQRENTPEYTGDMLRLTYRNSILESNTQIQLDNRHYRHDYLPFNDWANTQDLFQDSRKRREYNLTLNQGLTAEHSLYATLSRTESADNSISRSWQIGWNGSWKLTSFSLAWSMTRNESDAEWDKQLAFTLSVPLGEWFPASQPMINYTTTSGMKGDVSQQMGIAGKVGERQDLNWNMQISSDTGREGGDTQSGSMGLDYQGKYGDMNVTYNAEHNQYFSWNASGSIVAHRHGVTAGRYSNNSLALVAIPEVADIPLDGGLNISTDWRGYAIVPDLQTYRRNSLSIDSHANRDVDFVSTSAQVVPTKDAIVLAKFEAISGRKVVMTVTHQGKIVPFGARANIEGSDDTYYVGDMGQVYLNAAPDSGSVTFRWGDNQTCSAPYKLPEKGGEKLPVAILSVVCH
ncbi:fimbrial biogenesis outer membrane usher protein [Enterobacter cloacae complex sp. ECC445]|uniref:fimbria/pilus outer membrane usher protein n=1 Tax=Enterobacter cloacae complex sp. ECC445 TaxID=2913213 RepID=UPI001F485104|nr:fimbria/pilus outer membrane usher protein [Enterobacter cloacae complex sp. ECC445]MCG0457716.1 fimbrial biogenesis outer membrane usher protein [Enterobacter cloacae complex sp. ECC445]